jgi:hypothetical protein
MTEGHGNGQWHIHIHVHVLGFGHSLNISQQESLNDLVLSLNMIAVITTYCLVSSFIFDFLLAFLSILILLSVSHIY